jgi:hypothetical protein
MYLNEHAKKTTNTLTMTNYDRLIMAQTVFTIGLRRFASQCNRTKTTDKEENIKSPRFAFLKISANVNLAHLQSAQANQQPKLCKRAKFPLN